MAFYIIPTKHFIINVLLYYNEHLSAEYFSANHLSGENPHCTKNYLNVVIKTEPVPDMQMQQDIFSKTIWNICTVASATIRTGPVLMGRFRLFLGQCGNDSTEHVISGHADYILRAEYLYSTVLYIPVQFSEHFSTKQIFHSLFSTVQCTVL